NITWDDQVRVFIDGQNVFDDFSLDGVYPKSRTFDATLTAGPHTLTVEFAENNGNAQLQLQWQTLGPVPTLGPSPTPGPTSPPPVPSGSLSATVIRAAVLNVRSGPFLGAERVGRILRGQTYQVVGRDPDARWFLLQLSDRQAWAYGYYLAINTNEFNAPVANAFVTQGEPAASTSVVAQAYAGLKLRAEPSVTSPQIGRIPWGYILPVLARTPGDGAWWQVYYKDTVGWVFAPYLHIIEGDRKDIPTIER
ncbi:MAG: SH3 domain-containing protein, partial [Anaerolineae bacterium]|nr:SH3 domain-containing protein [Anaerolineae bacterium]